MLAILLNHAVYINTTWNSPLAQCVAAQVKDVGLLVAGVWGFDKGSLTGGNMIGAGIAFVGSVLYAGGRFLEGRKRVKREVD